MVMHALLFCLGTIEREKWERDSRRLDSDCRTANCDGRHNFIWTPIRVFKYSIESSSSLLSNGFGLISTSYWG
uniref:Cl335_1 n=1 Tax=Arundo donax TaxID=35708 RepID=A0A0A9C5C2_ARUDO